MVKVIRDRFPAELVIRRKDPEGFGQAKGGEDEKAFPISRLLEQADGLRGQLGMVRKQETQEQIRVGTILYTND